MRSLIIGGITVCLSFSSFADTVLVKSCSTDLVSLEGDSVIPTVFEINNKNGKLVAKVTQTVDGHRSSYEEHASIQQNTVRAGLTADTNPDGLNQVEGLVVHALSLESDPVFEGRFKSGINLKKVRSAKIFIIGEVSNMGSSTIVEARDAKGKVLGSFLGGFLISPCK